MAVRIVIRIRETPAALDDTGIEIEALYGEELQKKERSIRQRARQTQNYQRHARRKRFGN